MKKLNRHQTKIGFQNEIASGSDTQGYHVRFRSDGYFHRTARHPTAPDWFVVVLFRRSIVTGMMRAILHVCHQVRLVLLS